MADKTKAILTEFLKDKGASSEELDKFNKAYDDDISNLMKSDAEKQAEALRLEQEKQRIDIAELASKANIR